MGNWIEINSEQDLPNEEIFCWWVNRVNGTIHPSKRKGQLGRSMTHLTFSHFMIIDEVPIAPSERKQVEQTSWTKFDVNKILQDKLSK